MFGDSRVTSAKKILYFCGTLMRFNAEVGAFKLMVLKVHGHQVQTCFLFLLQHLNK